MQDLLVQVETFLCLFSAVLFFLNFLFKSVPIIVDITGSSLP